MIEPRDVEQLGGLISSMRSQRLNPPAMEDLQALERIHAELVRALEHPPLTPLDDGRGAIAA